MSVLSLRYYERMHTFASQRHRSRGRLPVVFLMMFFGVASLYGQSMEFLEERFLTGDLSMKVQVMRTATRQGAEENGPLFHRAIRFAVGTLQENQNDQRLEQMLMYAVRGVQEADYTDAADDAWRLFLDYNNLTVQFELLKGMGRLARNNPRVILDMTDWMRRQHGMYAVGGRPNLQLVGMLMQAMGETESELIFAVTVESALLGYPETVARPAFDALDRIGGDRRVLAGQFIRVQPVTGRARALEFFLSSDIITDEEKISLAIEILDAFAHSRNLSIFEIREYQNLRGVAAAYLANLRHQEATPAMIRHFDQSIIDYEANRITQNSLVDAIGTLGAMDTDAASRRLGQYLNLLNTRSEGTRHYDTQIVLAVIAALKDIQSPAGMDALYFTLLLDNFPTRIHQAAEEAVASFGM